MENRRLVLHFDVNNTILMQDSAQEYTSEYMVKPIQFSKILAGQIWGTVEETESSKVWRLSYNTISFTQPSPDLISYADFAKMIHRRKSPKEEPDTLKRQALNKEKDQGYKKLITEFMEPGKPGNKFRPLMDKMMKSLSSSRIVPSFFKLLEDLKASNRHFSILLRTFGSDLKDVIEEFNLYTSGQHPTYKSSGFESISMGDQNTAYFTRVADGDQYLVVGTLSRHPREEDPEEVHAGAIDEGTISVFKDYDQIYIAQKEILEAHGCMVVEDDYEYWNSNGEEGEFGKLLLVDQTDYETQHIFFDDNIEESSGHIVDARDLITGQVIPHEIALNKYYVQVDPYKAITQADYFNKCLLLCEENRTAEIRKNEYGEEEVQEEEVETFTDWELLQKLPTYDYLAKVIYPILLPGIKAVDMLRPTDPVAYLALYMLKNQGLAKLPPVLFTEK